MESSSNSSVKLMPPRPTTVLPNNDYLRYNKSKHSFLMTSVPHQRYSRRQKDTLERSITGKSETLSNNPSTVQFDRQDSKAEDVCRANFLRKHRMDEPSIRYFLRIMRSTRLSGKDIEDAINNITISNKNHLDSSSFLQQSSSIVENDEYKIKETQNPHKVKNSLHPRRNASQIYLQQCNLPWLTLKGQNINLRHQSHVRNAIKSSRAVQSAPPGVDTQYKKQDFTNKQNRSMTPCVHHTRANSKVLAVQPLSTTILGYYGNSNSSPRLPAHRHFAGMATAKKRCLNDEHRKATGARSIVVKLPSSQDDRLL